MSNGNNRLYGGTSKTSIRVYRNGDAFFTARRVTISKMRNMNVLLDQLTPAVQPFGPVRRLYTPVSGTRITEIGQIKNGEAYVASNNGGFKPVNYSGITDLRSKEINSKQNRTSAVAPLRTKRFKLTHKHRRLSQASKPSSIWLIRNGDKTCQYVQHLLTPRNTITWDQCVQEISDKMDMLSAVRKVFTIAGKEVCAVKELENGCTYIAARSKFKALKYVVAPPGHKLGGMSTRRNSMDMPVLPRGLPRHSLDYTIPMRQRRKTNPRATLHAHQVLVSSPTPLQEYIIIKDSSLPVRPPLPQIAQQKELAIMEEVIEVTDTVEKADEPLISLTPLPSIPSIATAAAERPQSYITTVETCDVPSAGTHADVYITIFGALGRSERTLLNDDAGNFAKGKADTFAVESKPLGCVQRIRLELSFPSLESDGDRRSGRWKVGRISVTDAISDEVVYFHCHDWLVNDNLDLPTRPIVELQGSHDANPATAAELVDLDGNAYTETQMRAAKKVQAVWRGRVARKRLNDMDTAALQLQALFFGVQARQTAHTPKTTSNLSAESTAGGLNTKTMPPTVQFDRQSGVQVTVGRFSTVGVDDDSSDSSEDNESAVAIDRLEREKSVITIQQQASGSTQSHLDLRECALCFVWG